MKAKAVVFSDRNQVEVRDVRVPEPTVNDVVIDVECSWISIGTESSYLRGERISGEQMCQPGDPNPFPHVPGYQKVGTIRWVGPNVRGLQVGDKVFASISKVDDMFFDFGGHISPAVTSAHQVWKLPKNACAEDYAGMVLTQVGYNCGVRPEVQTGDVAVVIGDGLVGQWTAQTLCHRGASVTVLGRHDERLTYLPYTISGVNSRRQSLQEVGTRLGGIHVVVDTVGDMGAVQMLKPFMSHNSHLVSAGFLGNTGVIDIQSLREQEITLHTPSGWQRERMDRTLEGISEGWLITSPLVTHRFSIDEAKVAWDVVLESKHTALGVVLDW